MKPKIAVTLGSEQRPSDQEYLAAIAKSGGDPVAIRPGDEVKADDFDGLLLSGGDDVDPEFYREMKEPFCDLVDRERDEFEFLTLKNFQQEAKPVLAICRGIQLINVEFGGSLYQDMGNQIHHPLHDSHKSQEGLTREQKRAFRHSIRIEKGSRLYDWFGAGATVNSRHHQAIKELSPALRVVAVSEDGIVEAVEGHKDATWIVGVQWHPEAREVCADFKPLFEGFVSACNERSLNAPTPRRT